jgi:hypothetical protein
MTDFHHDYPERPELPVDPGVIAGRLGKLGQADLCGACREAILPVAADTARLLTEVIRLRDALAGTRMESANRLAAMRAALSAAADNETDPLGFLRDEICPGTDAGRGQ